jgi:hypothetical protein
LLLEDVDGVLAGHLHLLGAAPDGHHGARQSEQEFFVSAAGVELGGRGFEQARILENGLVIVLEGQPFPEQLGGAVGIRIDGSEAAVAGHEVADNVPGERGGGFEGFGEVVHDPDFVAGAGVLGQLLESCDFLAASDLGVAGHIKAADGA